MRVTKFILLLAFASVALARRSRDDDDNNEASPAVVEDNSTMQSVQYLDPVASPDSGDYVMVAPPDAAEDITADGDGDSVTADEQSSGGDERSAAPVPVAYAMPAQDGDEEMLVDPTNVAEDDEDAAIGGTKIDGEGDDMPSNTATTTALYDSDEQDVVPVAVTGAVPADPDDASVQPQQPQGLLSGFLAPRTQVAQDDETNGAQQPGLLAREGGLSGLLDSFNGLFGQQAQPTVTGQGAGLTGLLSSFGVLASGGNAYSLQPSNARGVAGSTTRAGTFNGWLNSVASALP